MTETYISGALKIGEHNGWTLFYYPSNNSFGAEKGRKHRTNLRRESLINDCDDADAEEIRKERRIEPCEFVRWNPATQAEQKVRLTSFSTKGVALKPVPEGETVYLDRNRWGNRDGTFILVVKPGAKVKRLYEAVEMVRRAQAELEAAQKEVIEPVQVKDPGYGTRTAEFHAEEDRLRATINKVLGR